MIQSQSYPPDRQTDKQTVGQTDSQSDRQTSVRQAVRQSVRQTDRQCFILKLVRVSFACREQRCRPSEGERFLMTSHTGLKVAEGDWKVEGLVVGKGGEGVRAEECKDYVWTRAVFPLKGWRGPTAAGSAVLRARGGRYSPRGAKPRVGLVSRLLSRLVSRLQP